MCVTGREWVGGERDTSPAARTASPHSVPGGRMGQTRAGRDRRAASHRDKRKTSAETFHRSSSRNASNRKRTIETREMRVDYERGLPLVQITTKTTEFTFGGCGVFLLSREENSDKEFKELPAKKKSKSKRLNPNFGQKRGDEFFAGTDFCKKVNSESEDKRWRTSDSFSKYEEATSEGVGVSAGDDNSNELCDPAKSEAAVRISDIEDNIAQRGDSSKDSSEEASGGKRASVGSLETLESLSERRALLLARSDQFPLPGELTR